jgi:hypothetical protein
VTFGGKRWTGKSDADLSVRVLAEASALKLELAANDDRKVPPPPDANPRTIVRTDHFELWFCGNPQSMECQQTPAQLAVAAASDGTALARWLRPPSGSAAVPAASIEKQRLVVTLPRSLVGALPGRSPSPLVVPFTVAYSDSDGPAAGQQTMVATAPIRNAKPERPSLLSIPDRDGPYPRWPRAKPMEEGRVMLGGNPQ